MTTTATIKAGISASLTGQFATQGQQALAGLSAWVDYVNGQGGLAVGGEKRPVALVSYDDGSAADATRRATERLITDDRVDLLFGPYSAGLTTAAAEVAETYGKVVWNHGGAGDAHYARGFRKVISVLTPADQYLVGAPALVRQANPEASKIGHTAHRHGGFRPAGGARARKRRRTSWGSPRFWTCATGRRRSISPRSPATWPNRNPTSW